MYNNVLSEHSCSNQRKVHSYFLTGFIWRSPSSSSAESSRRGTLIFYLPFATSKMVLKKYITNLLADSKKLGMSAIARRISKSKDTKITEHSLLQKIFPSNSKHKSPRPNSQKPFATWKYLYIDSRSKDTRFKIIWTNCGD